MHKLKSVPACNLHDAKHAPRAQLLRRSLYASASRLAPGLEEVGTFILAGPNEGDGGPGCLGTENFLLAEQRDDCGLPAGLCLCLLRVLVVGLSGRAVVVVVLIIVRGEFARLDVFGAVSKLRAALLDGRIARRAVCVV